LRIGQLIVIGPIFFLGFVYYLFLWLYLEGILEKSTQIESK